MFYTLHRLVKSSFYLLAAACLFWLYTQRAVFQPLWAWYDVYQNGGLQKTERLAEVNGEGTVVLNGHTFQMKADGHLLSVRLTGFDLPTPPLSRGELELEKRRRAMLQAAVVGKPVRAEITYSNQNNILAIVHAGTTNLNTYFVASGLSRLNKEYVKSAPRELQYQFFAAARMRSRTHEAN